MQQGRQRVTHGVKLFGHLGHARRKPRQQMIGQDICRALVLLPRHRISPRKENTVHRKLLRRERDVLSTCHDEMRVWVERQHLWHATHNNTWRSLTLRNDRRDARVPRSCSAGGS
jgi:hypothetical protein